MSILPFRARRGVAVMSEEQAKKHSGSGWERVNSRTRSLNESDRLKPLEVQSNSGGNQEPSLAVPEALEIRAPLVNGPGGLIMRLRKNQIDRKAALDALQSHYNAQLDLLGYQLRSAVTVSKARADRIAEEFLSKLDSEHIEVLKELGLRNAEVRAAAMIQARDMIAKKLREVQDKDWPEKLVERAIDDLLELERRVCSEMMRELGT
jgi:hypothetical protein